MFDFNECGQFTFRLKLCASSNHTSGCFSSCGDLYGEMSHNPKFGECSSGLKCFLGFQNFSQNTFIYIFKFPPWFLSCCLTLSMYTEGLSWMMHYGWCCWWPFPACRLRRVGLLLLCSWQTGPSRANIHFLFAYLNRNRKFTLLARWHVAFRRWKHVFMWHDGENWGCTLLKTVYPQRAVV